METGQKFFSKDDVIHFIKVRSSDSRKPQPTNRRIKKQSKIKSKPVSMKFEHPIFFDHLPLNFPASIQSLFHFDSLWQKQMNILSFLTGYLMVGMWRSEPETVVHELEQSTRYDIHLLSDLIVYALHEFFHFIFNTPPAPAVIRGLLGNGLPLIMI